MARIAVIGLGAMGSRLAARLLEHDHEVSVWNRTPEKMETLVQRGASGHDSPAAAARGAEAVMTMVADPDALIAVTEGDDGALSALQEGATLIEMSTVGPRAIARLAQRMPSGRSLMDAPVLGSTGEVEAGTLKVFAGGDESVYARWEPVFAQLGEPIHVGPVGSGAAAKLVANLTLVTSLTAVGEAVALADGLGLDRGTTFDVLSATPLAAPAQRRRDPIQNRAYPRRFALALALKDAELVRKAASDNDVDLKLVPAAGAWFAEAVEESWGELDYSAVLAKILGEDKPT